MAIETKKNIRMQQLKQDKTNHQFYYETMYPETVSEQVKYEGNVVGSAGVGPNPTKYSTTKEALDSMVGHINTVADGMSSAHTRLDELTAIVNESGQAIVYDDAIEFATKLAKEPSDKYRKGTQILIVDTNSPDYWISKVFDADMGFTSTEIGTGGFFYCGYYGVSILEVAVDLGPYQKKNDNSLTTVNKFIVPAINEVAGKVDSAQTGVNTNADTLKKIVEGTTENGTTTYISVGNANNANLANEANSAKTAEEATKLGTAREIKIAGDFVTKTTEEYAGSNIFDGSKNIEITAELKPSGVDVGTYSAVTVDAKGRVTAGTQFIEVGNDINADATSKLPINGIFFRRVA